MNGRQDQVIAQQVTNKLAAHGVSSSCDLTVRSSRGAVAQFGTVQFAYQKRAALRVVLPRNPRPARPV